MPVTDPFPFVYRFKSPAGLRGQRCRQLGFPPKRRDKDGMVIWNAGDQLISVEFPDGRVETVCRSAIVSAASKLGRMTVARIARGDKRPSESHHRRRATT